MFQITTINTGYIMADGGAMFGAIPKRSWQRKYKCTADNLCPLAMRTVLATSADRAILVDLGIGTAHLQEVAYYQPHGLSNLVNDLAINNLAATDITDVVLTHLHFDHCGSAIEIGAKPTFPNATYWISVHQWQNLQKPNALERNSIFVDDILALYNADKLKLIANDSSLYPGMRVKLYDGHSAGQLVVLFDTPDGTTAIPGDLIPTSAHISLDWISAYDICALKAYDEKVRFLEEAVQNDYTLIYYHDVFTKSSKVKRLNENFIVTDIQKGAYTF